ncbi:MAG: hypothetical protein MI717_11050 [Spirochaetales bacterium]|nr:hypothetical protein [Spirochaetales bacterium]
MITFGVFSYAQEWPDAPERLTALFGHPDHDGYSQGVEFAPEGQRIESWNDGEVIWSGGLNTPLDVPSRSLVVVAHPHGFRSLYRGVDPQPGLEQEILKGDWLGYASPEGWNFSVKDTQRGCLVNPVDLLPVREERFPLSRKTVALRRGKDQVILTDSIQVPSGVWTLTIQDAANLAGGGIPTEYSLYWLGQRVAQVRFDALVEADGVIMMETPEAIEFQGLYGAQGELLLGSVVLSAGRGTLELRVKDDAGESMAQSWTIQVVSS